MAVGRRTLSKNFDSPVARFLRQLSLLVRGLDTNQIRSILNMYFGIHDTFLRKWASRQNCFNVFKCCHIPTTLANKNSNRAVND